MEEVKVGALALLGVTSLVGFEDTIDDDPVAREDLAGQVVLQLYIEGLGLLTASQFLGRLLHSDLLSIDELRLGEHELERSTPVAGLVHALQILVLELVASLLFEEGEATPLALESGGDDLGPDLGGRPDQAVNGQQLAYLIRAQLASLEVAGQLRDAHVGPVHVNIHRKVELQHGGARCFQRLFRVLHQLFCEVRIELVYI